MKTGKDPKGILGVQTQGIASFNYTVTITQSTDEVFLPFSFLSFIERRCSAQNYFISFCSYFFEDLHGLRNSASTDH